MLSVVLPAAMLLLLLWIIVLPARLGVKLILNVLCAFGSLILANLLSPFTGMLFELNFFTCAIVGFLGLPGLGALIILHCILG